MRLVRLCIIVIWLLPVGKTVRASSEPPIPVVEIEEDVYSYEPANNGAGPMWCAGSTCLVRVDETCSLVGWKRSRGPNR